MKIIHCSDLHLDSKMESHLSLQQAKERKKEILLTFERLVDYAESNKVAAIIIAGDMFDSPRVSQTTKNRVISLIKNHKDIKFFYVAGNHDEQNIISTLEDCPENLVCFGKSWQTYELEGVAITGAELSPAIYDLIRLEEGKVNIVVLHGDVKSAGGEDSINLSKLKNKFIDYLALGHYHFYEENPLDKRGRYCYSGCLEGRGFDECGEKGFVLLDVENKKIFSKFISFASRTLQIVEVDISSAEDWYGVEKLVMSKLSNVDENSIVRVVLTGHYPLGLTKDLHLLDKKIASKFYFSEIEDKSKLKIEPKDYENDLSLKGEFIRQVLESKLAEEDKEKIILIGINALLGEDISL